MSKIVITQTEPKWHLVNVDDKVLGRISCDIATLLRGKGKASFVNHLDCGDHVVVVNASKIKLTGNKLEDKAYFHYSGFHGGMKKTMLKDLLETKPEEIIISAVKGMLPKNKLQNGWLKRLHVYAGDQHPHVANVGTVK